MFVGFKSRASSSRIQQHYLGISSCDGSVVSLLTQGLGVLGFALHSCLVPSGFRMLAPCAFSAPEYQSRKKRPFTCWRSGSLTYGSVWGCVLGRLEGLFCFLNVRTFRGGFSRALFGFGGFGGLGLWFFRGSRCVGLLKLRVRPTASRRRCADLGALT